MNLTHRQLQIVKLMAQGYSDKFIMKSLNISHGTLCTHRTVIYERLGLFAHDENISPRLTLAKWYWNNNVKELKND